MITRQSSMMKPYPLEGARDRGNDRFFVGVVESVNYTRGKNSIPGTVDVRLWVNSKFSDLVPNCRVSTKKSGYTGGQAENDTKQYGDVDMPNEGDTVVLLFVEGYIDRPVIIANLHNLDEDFTSPLFNDKLKSSDDYVNRKLELHESGFWKKVDKNGNFEIHLPDGSFLQFIDKPGAAVYPDTLPSQEDLSEEWRHKNQPEKYFILNHPSGTWVRINRDGSVEMVVKGNMQSKVMGNLTEHIIGNVGRTINGNLTETVIGDANIDVLGQLKLAESSNDVIIASGTQGAARLGDKAEGQTDLSGGPSHSHTITGTDVTITEGSTKVKIG